MNMSQNTDHHSKRNPPGASIAAYSNLKHVYSRENHSIYTTKAFKTTLRKHIPSSVLSIQQQKGEQLKSETSVTLIITNKLRKYQKADSITYWICSNLPFGHKCICRSSQFPFQQIIMNIDIKPVTQNKLK